MMKPMCLMVIAAMWVCGCDKSPPPPVSSPPVDAPTQSGAVPAAPRAEPPAAPRPPVEPSTPAAVKTPATPPAAEHGKAAPAAEPPDPHAGMRDPHAGLNLPKTPPPDPHAATGGKPAAVPHPSSTELVGISLSVPEGWVAETVEASPGMPQLAPKAAYGLAPAEGDPKGAQVRVTHYPEMKGKDDINLERWYGQFTQPDGRPTKDVSKVEKFDLGEIKILLADIPGTMMVAGTATPDQRMLSAIINHPKGPHFVKVLGPDKTVVKWRDSVVAYLKSARMQSGSAG